jgi:hypothetical protein
VNNDILEMWGRWALATAKGQQQMNTMSGMLQNGMQMMESLGSVYMQLWGGPPSQSCENQVTKNYQNLWEPMIQMQQNWMQMLTSGSCQTDLIKKVADLEQKVTAHAHMLELMKTRVKIVNTDHKEEFTKQFKDLIECQNQQFQQLTSSFSQYFREQSKSLEQPNK